MEHDDNNNFLQQITKRLETVFSNNARNYSLYRQMLSIVTIEVLNKVCNSVCSIASPIFKIYFQDSNYTGLQLWVACCRKIVRAAKIQHRNRLQLLK